VEFRAGAQAKIRRHTELVEARSASAIALRRAQGGGNNLGVELAGLTHGLGKPVREFAYECRVGISEPPRAVQLGDAVADAGKCLTQHIRSLRAGRGAKALVACLMRVEGFGHDGIGLVFGRPALVAVVGQHRVEGGPALGHGGREASDEIGRDEVEEGRGRDEVGARAQRAVEVTGDVGAAEVDVEALCALEQDQAAVLPVRAVGPGGETLGSGIQQGLVVVDQRPALVGAKQRRGGAQVGAGAAAQVDDGDRAPTLEMPGQPSPQLDVARAVIDRLAQIEPLRAESAHWASVPTPKFA